MRTVKVCKALHEEKKGKFARIKMELKRWVAETSKRTVKDNFEANEPDIIWRKYLKYLFLEMVHLGFIHVMNMFDKQADCW